MMHRKGWLAGIIGIVLLLSAGLALAQVRVDGSYRRDGTYVQPHYRTAPDSNRYNNYGYPGNYNPNTGRITGGDSTRYLQRDYEPQPQPYGGGLSQPTYNMFRPRTLQ
jgi:hypothetical protein